MFLSTCAASWPARLARVRLSQLPDMDFVGEACELREQGRLGEARLVIRAGAPRRARGEARLVEESRLLSEAESSWLRRAKDVSVGAITGRGETRSALIGSMTSDLLIAGDARDLLFESGKALSGEQTDEVMIALGALGVGTTAAPFADWVPSLLKWARRRGALSDALAEDVLELVRSRSMFRSASFLWDIGTLARRASPGGAGTILAHADSIEDVRRLARCAAHHEHGAFALVATGSEGTEVLRRAPTAGHSAAIERGVVLASYKGRAGARFLHTQEGRALSVPHPLARAIGRLGLIHPARLVSRVLEAFDPLLIVLIPGLGAWLVIEACHAWRASRPRKPILCQAREAP